MLEGGGGAVKYPPDFEDQKMKQDTPYHLHSFLQGNVVRAVGGGAGNQADDNPGAVQLFSAKSRP